MLKLIYVLWKSFYEICFDVNKWNCKADDIENECNIIFIKFSMHLKLNILNCIESSNKG